MMESELDKLRASLLQALQAADPATAQSLANSEEFLELAKICSYRSAPEPDYESDHSGLSYGQLRMKKAIVASRVAKVISRNLLQRSAADPYQFSALVSVYNSADFLPDLFKSIDEQEFQNVEYIFVDDGSQDGSLDIIRSWASRKTNVTLIGLDKNTGPASARNLAIEFATGCWITVVDSDDVLDRNYFQEVFEFMQRHPDCSMYTTRVLRLNGTTGEVADSLPLGFKYREGNRVINLDAHPTHIQLGATAFLKRARLETLGLMYDERVRPTFEDGNLICRYLLSANSKENSSLDIGEIASALYFYRSRNDNSSLVQSGWSIGERYDDQLRFGYLYLLRDAIRELGFVPKWLGNTVLYDLSWYFTEDITTRARTMWLYHQPRLKQTFLSLLEDIFALLPKDSDPCRPVSQTIRDTWSIKYWGAAQTGSFCQHFFDEPFAYVAYEKEPRLVKGSNPLSWPERMRLRQLVTRANPATNLMNAVSRKRRHLLKKAGKLKAVIILNLPWVPTRLKDAWIITDRVTGAGDNGEHLYRWIVDNTDQKAFYVLRRGAPGWDRLKSSGYKVLPYGSVRSILAYLNASAIISSDAVVESRNLAPAYLYGRPKAPFIFLQHGVIYNRNIKNIAGWLNTIDIDLMFTSSKAETEYVAGNDSRFRIAPDRVFQNGMPRWDRLIKLSNEKTNSATKRVLLMPTWFPGKDYSSWRNLASLLKEKYEVQMVAHPSIAQEVSGSNREAFVDPRQDDFQASLAQCDVLVTDYSSVLYDALTIGRRVILYRPKPDRPVLSSDPRINEIPVTKSPQQLMSVLRASTSQAQTRRIIQKTDSCSSAYDAIAKFLRSSS
ncbi:glycosyltransferase [uncultured Corynebacterium sp.]|nr:glycosyltransferase [uncultured Corynebacterium sp.]OFT30686.1 hypothetical protein HMPREF3170_04055 [Corynebacterium sp. HMSC08D02]